VSHFDDLSGFGAITNGNGNGYGHTGLGPEVTLNNESGQLSPLYQATGHGGSGGGSAGHVTAPAPTIVSSGNLTIELIWDSAIVGAGATVEANFMNTVTAAAKLLVADLGPTTTHKDTIYIDVGWNEIAGQAMSPSALGESMTNGYLVTDATLSTLLANHGSTPGSDPSITSTTQFFLPTAEAKALGLAGAAAGSVSSPDGYIGFGALGKGYSWQYTDANGNPIGTISSTQFSLFGVALHEITEAMGRISMEGLTTYSGHKTYTPLDLFDYSSYNVATGVGTLALSNTGGYFSANGGATVSGVFNNNKANSGDIADWASYTSPTQSGTTLPAGNYEDAFNAFGYPGYNDALTPEDLLVMKTLGY